MHDKDNMTSSKLVCQINWSGTALQFWLSVFRRLSYNHRFINKRILATKKTFRREKTRLTSPAVRAAATSKAWRDSGRTSFSPSQSTWRHEEALLEEFYPGGRGNSQWWPIRWGSAQKRYIFRLQVYERVGISLVEVYKRVGKSGCHLGLWKAPKGVTDGFYGFIKLRKRSIFVIDSYLKDSALRAFKTDAKF